MGNILLNTSAYEVDTGGGFRYFEKAFILENHPVTNEYFTHIPLNSKIFVKKIIIYSNVRRPEWQYAYVDIMSYGKVVDQMTLPPAKTIMFKRENFYHNIKSKHFGIRGAFRLGFNGRKPIYSSYYEANKTFFSCDIEIYF